ncbi:TY4B-J [Symbiodinium microadriaticum]|nr:TY4B-J [Symbiodinium microadriaticum]
MTDKVHLLSVHLQSMVEDVSAGAAKSAQSIRKDVKQVTSPGFFGSIGNFFKNLFR